MKGKFLVRLMLFSILILPACADQPTAPDIDGDELSLHRERDRRGARDFVARLDGAQEVPAVVTSGTGVARFTLNRHGKRLGFAVYVANAPAIVQAHIHLGPRGENGPVVAFLFGPADPSVNVDGLLARGWLTDDEVSEQDEFDGTVRELVRRMRNGLAYVNVHSEANPSGEVRGQIERKRRGERFYIVKLENLTKSQPFSPGAIASHEAHPKHAYARYRDAGVLFEVGEKASEGIRLIAENGDPSTAVAELVANDRVQQAFATPRPVGCIGCGGPFSNTLTTFIEAKQGHNRLSLAVMHICTNDGFTGLNSARLPYGYRARTFYARGYDSGTEANDELYTSIVDPCGGIGPVAVAGDGENNRTATDDVIRHHPGIQGGADLDPDVYGWYDPVLKVRVKQIR